MYSGIFCHLYLSMESLGRGRTGFPKHYNLDQTRQQAPAKLSFSYAEAHTCSPISNIFFCKSLNGHLSSIINGFNYIRLMDNHWYSSVLTLPLFIFVYDGHSLKYAQLWLDLKIKYLKMQQANTEWLKYMSPFGMASVWSFFFLFQFVSACSVFYDIPMYS